MKQHHYSHGRVRYVTYGRTCGGDDLPTSICLCRRHDTAEYRVGYANVEFGLHGGDSCSLCPRDEFGFDDRPRPFDDEEDTP